MSLARHEVDLWVDRRRRSYRRWSVALNILVAAYLLVVVVGRGWFRAHDVVISTLAITAMASVAVMGSFREGQVAGATRVITLLTEEPDDE